MDEKSFVVIKYDRLLACRAVLGHNLRHTTTG